MIPGAIAFEFPDLFFGGLWLTIQISVLGLIGALIVGTLMALLRVAPIAPLRWVGAWYVELFRNTPLVVQLFFLFLGLPLLGLRFATDTFDNIFRAALVGMALYHGAYVAEVVRGGLLGVERGQIEAGRSLGLSYLQTLRVIQLPQTFRAVIPPLGSVAIALVKNTALASTIGVSELLGAAETVETRTFRAEEAFVAATILYLAITLPLGGLVNVLERRLLVAR